MGEHRTVDLKQSHCRSVVFRHAETLLDAIAVLRLNAEVTTMIILSTPHVPERAGRQLVRQQRLKIWPQTAAPMILDILEHRENYPSTNLTWYYLLVCVTSL